MVLPSETERNVDCDSEGVGVGLGGGVEVEEVVGVVGVVEVVGGGGAEVDTVECVSEVDGGRDVEVLSPEGVLSGGGVVDELSLVVDTGLGLGLW